MTQKSTVNQGSVLVVDDDPMILEILREIISEQGCTVVTVESGESALEEVEKQRFDLIFLDLKLGGLSGEEILSSLKERDKDAVIVIITGYADDPIALKAMALGPLLLVRKPFREKDIIEVLNIVMKGKNYIAQAAIFILSWQNKLNCIYTKGQLVVAMRVNLIVKFGKPDSTRLREGIH